MIRVSISDVMDYRNIRDNILLIIYTKMYKFNMYTTEDDLINELNINHHITNVQLRYLLDKKYIISEGGAYISYILSSAGTDYIENILISKKD